MPGTARLLSAPGRSGGDCHRRFHDHRCRHGIVIAIPANVEIVHDQTGIVFTFRWNLRSRCAGNRDHDGPQYAV